MVPHLARYKGLGAPDDRHCPAGCRLSPVGRQHVYTPTNTSKEDGCRNDWGTKAMDRKRKRRRAEEGEW